MKQILKNLFTAALIVLFTTAAFAQDRAAEGAKVVTVKMKEQLTLNDSQYSKVLEINRTFIQKAIDIKGSAVTKLEKTKKLRALTEDRDTKLKSVLTDDQYKVYAANRAANRQKLREFYQDKNEAVTE